MIKMVANKIWDKRNQRLINFVGNIDAAEINTLEDNGEEGIGGINLKKKPQEKKCL